MTRDKDQEGRPSAAEKSRDGLPDNVTTLTPRERSSAVGRANFAKGTEAAKERGRVPRDPDYVSRRQQFVDGTLKVEDLEDEELEKLQFKDRHGNFTGRPPALTTAQQRQLHVEWRKRIARRFEAEAAAAMEVMKSIMNSRGAKDTDRLRAAEMMLARAIGREQQTVVNVNATWEDFEEGTIVEINREDVG